MTKQSNSQKRKTLSHQLATQRAIQLKNKQELEQLPEVEKLKLEIDELKGYINRYKNDMNMPMIASKVKMYQGFIENKQKRIDELLAQQIQTQKEGEINGGING